jgi:hypothetical protein
MQQTHKQSMTLELNNNGDTLSIGGSEDSAAQVSSANGQMQKC